jgi:hypothetical protein
VAQPLSLPARFAKVIIPTKIQAFVALVTSLVLVVSAQLQHILPLLNLDPATLDASRGEFQSRFSSILTSQIASSTALITFWASVGLIAYLICWGCYNLLIQTRNEVTLETQYINRGHWRGAFETLALKALGAITLICLVALIQPGLALWLALISPILQAFSVSSVLQAAAAIVGLAAQLYLLLACALLTFTPWYRPEVFTDAVE